MSMTQGSLTWTFGYDAAGNRTTLTQPNGTNTTYAYLTNNWLSSIIHKAPGGATLQSFVYTYDANGNRLTQADPTGTTAFGYDALSRLVSAAYPAGYGSWTWQYDPVGNRLTQTAPSGTTTYSYDANNRMIGAGGVTYAYDANGNLTSTSSGQSFAWDVFNRMTSATGGGGTATYTYNGDGLKIRRIGPDGTTRYYHDGIRPIWEADGAGSMTAQLDRDIFGNLLSRKEPAGTRRYYHFDGMGSTTALSDEGGAAVATLLYDAWGNQRTASGGAVPNYRFTGAELDTASGLYHMGARFYDPATGRWLSEDPVVAVFDPGTLNAYSYVRNRPALLMDPTGTCDQACLEELNRQRQALAKKAWELSRLAPGLRDVDLYQAARDAAREVGFESAEAGLDELIKAAKASLSEELGCGEICPVAHPNPNAPSRFAVKAYYVMAMMYSGTKVAFALAAAGFAFTPGAQGLAGVSAIFSILAGIGADQAWGYARHMDRLYYGGAVWAEIADRACRLGITAWCR